MIKLRIIIFLVVFYLLGILNTIAQDVSSPDSYLLDTVDKQRVLSSAKKIIQLPNPKGPYLVGTIAYHWVDRTRDEIVTDEDHDYRQVIAQIWFPAVLTKDSAPVAYFPELGWVISGLKTQKGDIFNKIIEDFKSYERVLTNSFPNADLDNTQKSYPLLIFATGGNISRHNYTAMMEEFASNGYIVAAISHPYSSMEFFPAGGFQDDYPHWKPAKNATNVQKEKLEQTLTNYLAEDARFVLDKMLQLNQIDPTNRFKARIDSNRVAILGHSRGGSTVSRAVSSDDRFQAAVIYDNIGPEPEVESGLSQPLLTMRAPWKKSRVKRLHSYLSANKSMGWEVVFDSATHFTFSDMPIVDPENYESNGDPYELFDRAMTYSLDFLDHVLKGKELEMLSGDDTDGVIIRMFKNNN